jgi:hypothetical protein
MLAKAEMAKTWGLAEMVKTGWGLGRRALPAASLSRLANNNCEWSNIHAHCQKFSKFAMTFCNSLLTRLTNRSFAIHHAGQYNQEEISLYHDTFPGLPYSDREAHHDQPKN